MIQMSLWFSDTEMPELICTAFNHPLLQTPREAIRGRPANTNLYPYSFQWSPAVKALSCLLLRGAIARHTHSELGQQRVALTGGRSSAALSLDHAISKQPAWICDMFGVDNRGDSLIRKIISRRNPGLKRPEPIELAIDTRQIALINIRIFFSQTDISDSLTQLQGLYRLIGFSGPAYEANEGSEGLSGMVARARFHLVEPVIEVTASEEMQPVDTAIPVAEEVTVPLLDEHELVSLDATPDANLISAPHPVTRSKTDPSTRRERDLEVEKVSALPNCLSPSVFEELLSREIHNSIRSIDIFSRPQISQTEERLWRTPCFSKVAGKPRSFLGELDLKITDHLLKGSISKDDPLDQLMKRTRIKVALPAAMVGTLSILVYMREVLKYDLDICYDFPSTGVLLRKMVADEFDDPPDICGLSLATAAVFLGNGLYDNYQPLMVTPKTSHRVLAPRGRKRLRDLSRGHYLFDTSESSTTSFFFEDLKESKLLSKNRVTIEHMGVPEMSAALQSEDEDLRAILWFPFDQFNIAVNNSVAIYGDADPRQWKETLLFTHNRFARRLEICTAFDVALRRAWRQLIESNRAVSELAAFLTSDPAYMSTVYNHSGLTAAPPPVPFDSSLNIAV